MSDECPKCECKTIFDVDCEECAAMGSLINGDECEICNGDGYIAGLSECSDCGYISDADEFEA